MSESSRIMAIAGALVAVTATIYGVVLLGQAAVGPEKCCEPYPELGCVDVEAHVCETEDEWVKATIMCGEEAGAFTELARMFGECEDDLQMSRVRARAHKPTMEELRERTEEIDAWLRSHAAKKAIESCRGNTRSDP